jgi:type IV pilus assembly protein PilB
MIVHRKSATELLDVARRKGLKLMREDGWAKVLKGVTTIEEIARVTKSDATVLAKK